MKAATALLQELQGSDGLPNIVKQNKKYQIYI